LLTLLCFQFVVFMDLIGTAALPISIALTYTLIVTYCLNPPHSFQEAIPLMLLIAVIGLPAVLILLATRKVVYVMWMLIYLIALPIWNFVLPVYSFWHFDDFSWGETRKVEGEGKDKGHVDEDESSYNVLANIPLRRWEDWERSRLRKMKREARRRAELEQQFGKGLYNEEKDHADQFLGPHSRKSLDSFSDGASDLEDDKWGAQIGGYDESLPPPLAIVRHSVWVDGESTLVGAQDMEEMLEKGWEEEEKYDGQPFGGNGWRTDNSFSPYPPVPRVPRGYGPLSNGNGPRGPPMLPSQQQQQQQQPMYRNGGAAAVSSGVDRNASGGQQQHARNRSQGQSGNYNPPPHMGNNRMQYPR
jgi:chitin synthase